MDEAREQEILLGDMAALVRRRMPEAGDCPGPLPGMVCHRRDAGGPLADCVMEPLVLLVLRGEKSARIAERQLRYGAGEYLLAGVHMPALHRIVCAEADAPFFSVELRLDRRLIGELLMEMPEQPPPTGDDCGIAVDRADLRLLRAFRRLADLLDEPEDAPVLGPLVVKELHYRLLKGPHGGSLRQLHTPEARSGRIAEAILWLREHYAEPLVIADLAKRVSLSETALFRQFKKVTTLSPLQYQKRLRLHEARRLLLAERLDVGDAGSAVGYVSPHQFSREYKRLFGLPPQYDAARRRGRAEAL